MTRRPRAAFCLTILSALALVFSSICSASAVRLSDPSQAKEAPPEYAPQRIIVGFVTDASKSLKVNELPLAGKDSLDSLNSRFGVERVEPVFLGRNAPGVSALDAGSQSGNVCLLIYTAKVDPLVVADAYRKLPEVRYAEPDRVRRALRTDPNDPYWPTSDSWGQGYRDQWDMEIMACPAAWDLQTGGSSVVIAVSDTGIDYNHADLTANMWHNPGETPGNGLDDDGNGLIDDYYGYDFANGDADPLDDNGHGTHCAGTIGAVGNNGTGIAGINWNCRLMALKGLDSDGSGYDSGLAAGIRYAADEGARVINMSWGGSGFSQTVHDALVYAHGQGVVLCAAGGNSADDIAGYCPAGENYVITVAASDQNDAACSFTNWGIKTAVSAPGGNGAGSTPPCAEYNCLSLRAGTTDLLSNSCGSGVGIVGVNYYRLAGTSMACPHVAGLAGLVLAQNPTWTNEQVRQAIQMRADDILTAGFDRHSGFGRVNAYAAVTAPEPLTALISSPLNGGEVSGTVSIQGTAIGTGLSEWILDYGLGQEPTSWTTLGSGTAAVPSGTLAQWDASAETGGLGTLRLRVNGTGDVLNAEYRLAVTPRTVEGSGHYTELFDYAPFDLANKTLVFTPDGSTEYYTLCVGAIAELPTDPAGGTALSLGDDDWEAVALPVGVNVTIYGSSRNQLYVSSNGYVTFDGSDSSFSESTTGHFSLKRISALFDDLDPGDGGSVSWKQLSDRVAVTFLNVPEFGGEGSNTFQIEMYFDGRIAISYLGIDAADGLAGLSGGLGEPTGFQESDLSAYPACIVPGRALRIQQPNGGEWYEPGQTVPVQWTATGVDWQTADKVSLEYSSSGGTDWNPIPGAAGLAYDAGAFNWETAGLPESSQYRVQVIFDADTSVTDGSNSSFAIATDLIPPAITHAPMSDTGDLTGPYGVCASVTDNLGVSDVTLYWSKNGGPFASAPMTLSSGSEYCGSIPGPSADGDQYCYYIQATDSAAAGNAATQPADAPASANCFRTRAMVSLPTDLYDGDSFRWDVQDGGYISNGTYDAFDDGFVLAGFPGNSYALIENSGRELVLTNGLTSGVEIRRKVYVPESHAYCRFLEICTNHGATALTVPVNLSTNLGSDSSTVIVGTSSGDESFGTDDQWIVTDDADLGDDPTVVHVIAGPGAPVSPVSVGYSTGLLDYGYSLTLQPGETRVIMHFGAQNANRAAALLKAPQITTLDPSQDCLAGMSAEEIAQVANFMLNGRWLRIISPNGGAWYEPGTVVPIQWTPVGPDWQAGDTVRLESSGDGGSTWSQIAGAESLPYNSCTIDWDTTGLPESSQYRVRVVCNSDAAIADASDSVFIIATDATPPVISHIPPGDTMDHAGPYEVVATVTDNFGVGVVTLHWSKNGGGVTSTVMTASGTPGEYVGSISGPSIDDDRYCYCITATDAAVTPNVARSPASDYYCFDILTCRPPAPVNPSPGDGGTAVPVDTTLSWNNSGDGGGDVGPPPPPPLMQGVDPATGAVSADETIINAGDRGWWRSEGTHTADNKNTLTGQYSSMNHRSFFVFDLASIAHGAVTDARLRLELERYGSNDATESLTVHDVSTPIPVLTASGTSLAVFNDLGTGSSYGGFSVGSGNVGTTIEIPLSTQAITDINTAAGGYFAVGLNVDTVGSLYASEWVRFSEQSETRTHQLVLTLGGAGPTTYDVYMGESCADMSVIAADLDQPTCDPGALAYNKTYYWQVVARNSCGETAGPCWSFTTEPSGIAKPADGVSVVAKGVVVTAAFPDVFYVEAEDRQCGIRAEIAAHGFSVGTIVNVGGVIRTNADGERYIEVGSVATLGSAEVRPLRVGNKSLGGGDWMYDPATKAGQKGITGSVGLNNIGLLVRIWGKVTAHGRDWFYIDDGACVCDGTGTTGIYCETQPGVAIPAIGAWVSVVGISSCESYDGKLVNVLLVRDEQGIGIISAPLASTGMDIGAPPVLRSPRDRP